MNTTLNAVGLSARQKININFNKFFWVLVALILLLLATLLSTNTSGQELKKNPPKGNMPQVDIKVNRHYDNKGNVIGYDSTYSSHYSSIQGDTLGMRSMLKSFNRYFSGPSAPFFDRRFDSLFFNDMTPNSFRREFFDDDFLLNHGVWHHFLDDMTHQLDSLKKGFYPKSEKNKHRL